MSPPAARAEPDPEPLLSESERPATALAVLAATAATADLRSTPRKLALVVPRYGIEVRGGAELGARMIAERVSSMLGWPVEVFTTCALEATTWANEYPEATEEINGVAVHRFRSASGRAPGFDRLSRRILNRPAMTSEVDGRRWIDRQGPVSPGLLDAVRASDADVVAFYPYLYHPTVAGLPMVAEQGRAAAIMHPAAHDEAPIRLALFRSVFDAADGFVFQTWGERRLVERLFPIAHRRQVLVGLGVDRHDADHGAAAEHLAAVGVGDRPYLLCLGRIDDGKGAGGLAQWFAAYKERHPGPLQLVYVGPVVNRPQPHPDVHVIGEVGEGAKWGLLERAEVLVNPSPYEAFSLVVIEAWMAGVPIVVNGRCEATVEHCDRSGGGLAFTGYASFEAAIERLSADADLRRHLAERGRAYVEAEFGWGTIVDRYGAFVRTVADARGSRGSRGSGVSRGSRGSRAPR